MPNVGEFNTLRKYRILYSVWEHEGKHHFGNAFEWCENCLTGEELQEFLSDREIFSVYEADAQANGYLTREELYETVQFTDGNFADIQVGIIITRDFSQSDYHPLALKWRDKFKNAPTTLKFNDEEELPIDYVHDGSQHINLQQVFEGVELPFTQV